MSAHMLSDRSFQLLEVVTSRMDSSPAVGRRNWPDETKTRIVEEALAPDVNVSAVARRYGMSPSQLFGWRRKDIAKGQVERREVPDVAVPSGLVSGETFSERLQPLFTATGDAAEQIAEQLNSFVVTSVEAASAQFSAP